MTVQQFIRRLEAYQKEIQAQKQRILTEAVFAVLADMQERIFTDGLDRKRQKIGEYSEKPIYVPVPYPQVRGGGLKRVGKTGKKTKKTQYLGGGYKEFRQKVGRSTERVNLDLTGSLRLSMDVGNHKDGKAIGFTSPRAFEIARGNEQRFGTIIFRLTKQERATFRKVVARKIRQIRKKTLG